MTSGRGRETVTVCASATVNTGGASASPGAAGSRAGRPLRGAAGSASVPAHRTHPAAVTARACCIRPGQSRPRRGGRESGGAAASRAARHPVGRGRGRGRGADCRDARAAEAARPETVLIPGCRRSALRPWLQWPPSPRRGCRTRQMRFPWAPFSARPCPVPPP